MKVVLATENAHKISEIRAILMPLVPNLKLVSLADISPEIVLPDETGETFEANAAQKAVYVANATGLPSIGDDSGLCVDALNGGPGIRSRRWAGDGASDADRIAKLLAELNAANAMRPEERGAQLVSAAALAVPGQEAMTVRGECRGVILDAPHGANGFGYDPVFFLPEFDKTMAQLSGEDKNRISHRARSFRLIADFLRDRA